MGKTYLFNYHDPLFIVPDACRRVDFQAFCPNLSEKVSAQITALLPPRELGSQCQDLIDLLMGTPLEHVYKVPNPFKLL